MGGGERGAEINSKCEAWAVLYTAGLGVTEYSKRVKLGWGSGPPISLAFPTGTVSVKVQLYDARCDDTLTHGLLPAAVVGISSWNLSSATSHSKP